MAILEGVNNSELGAAGQCCKKLLILFNVLFLITGVLAIALGLFLNIFPLSYHIANLVGSDLYLIASIILILAGIAVCAVAFCGCCAAKYENKCLLGAYFIGLLCIFVIEFLAGILSLGFYTQTGINIDNNLEDSIKEAYGLEGEEDITAAWDYVQDWFQCCGYEGNGSRGALMWIDTMWYLSSNVRVPKSCCARRKYVIVNLQLCQDRDSIDWDTFINNQGCHDMIFYTGIMFAATLGGVGVALSLIQLLGMVFSFCLFRRL